ncbi:MAG: winged helix-turn-helix transcriptional regulator [Acidobacteria bacterium]|nr:winged helix-turn-helix transcriptional regulator [Acidobacteriota bacterium]
MPAVRGGSALVALADPTRRALLDMLRGRPLPVGELARQLPVSRPAVSQHLKALKAAHLVHEHRQGTRHYFSLNPSGFAELRRYVDSMWENALTTFAAYVSDQQDIQRTRRRDR